MQIAIHGKQLSAGQFFRKTVCYIPRHAAAAVRKQLQYAAKQREQRALLALMRSEGKGTARTEKLMRRRLAALLREVSAQVPYYRQFPFLAAADKDNCIELLKKLPVTDKAFVREHEDSLRNAVLYHDAYPTWGHTGATTGKPLSFPTSYVAEDTHQRALYQYMTGMDFTDIVRHPFGIVTFCGTRPLLNGSEDEALKAHIYWKSEPADAFYGTLDFCSFYESDDCLPYYVRKLNEIQPLVIRGYSNAILSLARFAAASGTLAFRPKAVYVTSEYCPLSAMQEISRGLDCPVFGQYGQVEGSFFGWTAPNSDVYYLSPFYGYAEVLDDQGNPVEEGETGHLVVTGFGNRVQPWIRYDSGDMVQYGGREGGVLCLSGLKGRGKDFIYDADMQRIPLVGFMDIHYLKCHPHIRQYQIQQDEPGAVLFRLVKTSSWTQEDEDEIHSAFARKHLRVSFAYVDSIPLTTGGKVLLTVQHIKAAQADDAACCD